MNAPTAHEAYWETHHNPHVFQYDPTDDGPETDRKFLFWVIVIVASVMETGE